ncbi:site-specific DNA-methyltransferase [Flavobacterium aurantiibacter]|uniref:site-specific DNA-methyltransferase n=1 Tax=Flavobacterium aurantiibacter TaxID=2023067 RepID=UPI001A9CAA06|nr:DNA methyltransferase [Flavobacterium aurantiibacter]
MTNYDKLINTLKEVFMLDKAELDFGIYRIMNQKRKDIEQFLVVDLIPQVKEVLNNSQAIDAAQLKKQIDTEIETARKYGNPNPEELPQVQELKAQYERIGDLTSIENEVFSLLANFFKRYFDNGDFISMRRYKKDVYAIPYEGEEVKLHWANADQYYIKTSEYFKVYRFKLSNGKTVCFELVEASTEQNNNKTQGDKERRFAIYTDKVCETVGDEFKIYFTYEPTDKKVKQSELMGQAFDALKAQIPQEFLDLLSLKPTEKDKQRTLLQKHLNDYTARNTFDYFIHKDLGGFLNRELDFYIKNEVLFIDDLNTRDEQEFLKQLSKIKAIKKIGEKIIAFLAQLENFQKKLWLKKKMVVECNYCITLDRVPKDLHPEILNNQAQIQEWIKLFAIDEIKTEKTGSLFSEDKVGFSNPLTMEFLNQNRFLVLDTAFFSEAFKSQLISSIENFDDACDGLLINSDNYHALNLINKRYNGSVDGIYIDPPYNTDASSILYKNDYKDSSFLSLIENRITISNDILSNRGIICVAIDDEEVSPLRSILESAFFSELGIVAVRSNPAGRKTKGRFAPAHEYALFYGKSEKSVPGSLDLTEQRLARYPKEDENGRFAWANFIRSGNNDKREDRPKLYYPIFANADENKIRIPEMVWNNESNEYDLLEQPRDGEVIVYPTIKQGDRIIEKNWQRGNARVPNELSEYRVRKNSDGEVSIDFKTRLDESSLPTTWWDKKEYASANYGAAELKELFNEKPFDFPKAKSLVEDCIKALNIESNSTILDFFGGSATTGHSIISLNREDNGKRKYILVEMGEYFNIVTKPRIQKVIYSKDWKEGKPVSREGISHCFKYMRLESYEDTLNNLALKQTVTQQQALQMNPTFKEGYMLNYMLDVEAKESLLNLEWFENPFNCYLNITKNNELQPTKVDLVETFNYLIGLVVESYAKPKEGYVVVTGKKFSRRKNTGSMERLHPTQ